jgi:NitT/TauT family transport system ATP-binding protein
VFQNYREALFPWMRAIDNICYPLKIRGVGKAERDRRVEALLTEFDIHIDLQRYPYQLSGGQQQTVSILRALITEPEVLFLDEPFSALDYEMTLLMRDRIQRIFLNRNITMVLVSHDLEEAAQLATQVLLLTRRPTRIAETVLVDVPWPRDSATLTDPDFVSIRSRCLEVFNREVSRNAPPS